MNDVGVLPQDRARRPGEEIAAGITLAEVRADRVVISRSGAVQEIRLPAKSAPDGIVKVRYARRLGAHT